jgi:hypothetical protein
MEPAIAASTVADIGDLFTSEETAAFLRMSISQLRRLGRRKEIPYRRPKGRYLFVRSELMRWLDEAGGWTTPEQAVGRPVGTVAPTLGNFRNISAFPLLKRAAAQHWARGARCP